MKLVVISHKLCWRRAASPSGYCSDGGFPIQMRALAGLFDETLLVVPVTERPNAAGEIALRGHALSVRELTAIPGTGWRRKISIPWWMVRNLPVLFSEIARADAIHTPVPGDVGSIGMLVALALRKPLFVRHCGNWLAPKTWSDRLLKVLMERFAGGINVMLATGGALEPPSVRNVNVEWIFSTSLAKQELGSIDSPRQIVASRRDVRLIIVCRQDEKKGTGRLIAALPTILQDYPLATLDVVGDGQALPLFRNMAEQAGVANHIRFHGKVDHHRVVQLLAEADLFCYPTTASEGFPKVVLEALGSGLPVVTTPVSVLPHLLAAGGGVIVDRTDPEAIAASVKHCLADPHRYRHMSQCALTTAHRYSLENWCNTLRRLLEDAWGTSIRTKTISAA